MFNKKEEIKIKTHPEVEIYYGEENCGWKSNLNTWFKGLISKFK